MDAETLAQWRAADAAFGQWLDLPEHEREGWLAAQPLAGPVRRRLDQLIAAHGRPRAALDPGGSDLAGCRLGDWTLDDELGRGGMAVVYRAWREHGMARQQAAVKILTLGALGVTGRERFRREAEILARLNHPNVTALVDSGVADDGTCWLAMPLVDGERIDRWCDQHALDARAIVRLYLQVCDAVAYAHRNLVIHRDIKPSNVLVDAAGHVRLLDFGIGQFADAEGDRTLTMWRALTPGYAAPEQLRGEPPTTAVDVYGLGALLHRLLTGRTPHAATESTQTTRPSLLVHDTADTYHRHYVPLKSDLDRVLLKALAEEPGRRYATAEALADDLRRWLEGRPVLAEKPRLGYRMRKFVARNRVGVAAGALLIATVAAGIAATLWQAEAARRSATLAEQEADNARIQAQRAEQVRDFLEHVFTSTEPTAKGIPTALDLLEEGSRRAREEVMATDPGAAADILLLTGYARAHLSRYDEAARDLHDAQTLLRTHRPDALHELWRTHVHLGSISRTRGDPDAAIEHARAAARINSERSDATLDDRAFTLLNLGNALYSRDPVASERVFRELLDLVPGTELEDGSRHLAAVEGIVASRDQQGRSDAEQLALMEEQLRLSRQVDGEDEGAFAHTLASISARIASMPGHQERALEMARESVDIMTRVYAEPHYLQTGVLCNFGYQLAFLGELHEAIAHFDAGISNAEAIAARDIGVVSCLRGRGYARAALGRFDGAIADLASSREMEVHVGQTGTDSHFNACGLEASALIRLGRQHQARETLEGCAADTAEVPGKWWHQARAELLFATGDTAGARQVVAALRERAAPGGRKHEWMRPWMLSVLLAEQSGDTAARAQLNERLAGHEDAPLTRCLEDPTEENCLVIL